MGKPPKRKPERRPSIFDPFPQKPQRQKPTLFNPSGRPDRRPNPIPPPIELPKWLFYLRKWGIEHCAENLKREGLDEMRHWPNLTKQNLKRAFPRLGDRMKFVENANAD